MTPARRLWIVSTAQLAFGLAGLAIAVQRGHAYDALWFVGDPDRISRDLLLMGTALSAPVTMLVAQAVLTWRVAERPSRMTVAGLALLGGLMTLGYLSERLVRERLTLGGWDPLESPVAMAGLGLAALMAGLGLRARGGLAGQPST